MKRRIGMIAIGLICSAGVMGQVQVSRPEIRHNNGQIELSFEATVDPRATRRDNKLILTPVVSGGGRSTGFSPIVVETRRTRILDARNGVAPLPGALLTENGRTIHYTATAPYDGPAADFELRFDALSLGCCSEQTLPSLIVSGEVAERAGGGGGSSGWSGTPGTERMSLNIGGMILILNRYAALPAGPSAPTVRSRADTMETLMNRLQIGFAQGSYRLESGGSNYRALHEVVEILRSAQDVVLRGRIEIRGYASPEGTEWGNYTLAQERALAVRNYLLDNVHWLRTSNFDIVNGGENWDGLRELVEASSGMPGRWQVLDILENTPSSEADYLYVDTRKEQLQRLNGGTTWRYMLANLFPRLRNAASITIYAPIERSTVTTAALAPAPENAETINRAIDLIGRRQSAEALALLTPLANDPRTWNPLGVCYILENDLSRARDYFRRAAEAGYPEAQSNLEQTGR